MASASAPPRAKQLNRTSRALGGPPTPPIVDSTGQSDNGKDIDDDDEELGVDSTFLTGLLLGDPDTKKNDMARYPEPCRLPEPEFLTHASRKRRTKKQSTLSMSVGEYFQFSSASDVKRGIKLAKSNIDQMAGLDAFLRLPPTLVNPKPIQIMCSHQKSVERYSFCTRSIHCGCCSDLCVCLKNRRNYNNLDFKCYTSKTSDSTSLRSSLDGRKTTSAQTYRALRASTRGMARFAGKHRGAASPSSSSRSTSSTSWLGASWDSFSIIIGINFIQWITPLHIHLCMV